MAKKKTTAPKADAKKSKTKPSAGPDAKKGPTARKPAKSKAGSKQQAEPPEDTSNAEAGSVSASTGPSPGRMTAPRKGVKIRMYRTGLGDCFLFAFPKEGSGKDDTFYMLLDCGVYKGTPEGKEWIQKLVKNIAESTGGKLDLLAITHEHWDHVSAFDESQARTIFDNEIKLDKLWLAWTEDMSLPLAKELHAGRRAALTALVRAKEKMVGLGVKSDSRELVDKVLDCFGEISIDHTTTSSSADGKAMQGASDFGAASPQTAKALVWIKDTYGKDKTEYLHPGAGPIEFEGVPDARIYVLGPPEDASLIKRYNPSGDEVYSKAMAAALESAYFAGLGVFPAHLNALPTDEAVQEAQRMSMPFDSCFHLARKEVEESVDALNKANAAGKSDSDKDETTPGSRELRNLARYLDPDDKWRQIDDSLLETAGEFALQLDSATNNTSLAFALEIGPAGDGKVLLFPGDAQVGNWESWHGKVEVGKRLLGKDMIWKVGGKTITAKDLLARTVLYKVGHHGSHNATLKQLGLELMGPPHGAKEMVAFLPVNEHVARDLAHYGEMPLRSLMKELSIRTKGRIARNDEGDPPKDQTSTLQPIPGAPPITSDFVDVKTEHYFEYTVAP